MTPALTASRLATTYPSARIRGRLTTRQDERSLGWAVLDAARAEYLGREGLGWFIGGHPGVRSAAAQLGRLDANPEGGVWVVVPVSGKLTQELFALWPHREHVTAPASGAPAWRSRKVWVIPPERLREFRAEARQSPAGVAGVILVDPPCIMYSARGGRNGWGHRHTNDRPQHVANFRHDLTADGWQPPLILLTEAPAKAVNAEAVARAFDLSAFQFVAGNSLGCWEMPIESE